MTAPTDAMQDRPRNDPDRLIDYKKHPGLPGKWRARPVRYGSHVLEVELPCINGLSAWFTVATFHAAEDAERLMTDGARMEAGEYAARIAAAMQDRRAGSERANALEECETTVLKSMDEVGRDWRDAGMMQKFYATNYLAEHVRGAIRALKDKPLPAPPEKRDE